MQRSRDKTLFDILQAIDELESFRAGVLKEDFLKTRSLQLIFEREFEIIGEALNRLLRSDEDCFCSIRDAHKIVGLRNVLAHGYDIIDYEILWDAAAQNVPLLKADVERLLNPR
jgi:uncharacterized protein with HEPN domain